MAQAVWQHGPYKDLEKENGRLRQIVSDLELDKSIMKEALDFLEHRG